MTIIDDKEIEEGQTDDAYGLESWIFKNIQLFAKCSWKYKSQWYTRLF